VRSGYHYVATIFAAGELSMPDERIISIDVVAAMVGLHKATIFRLVKARTDPFPAPLKLSPNRVGWRASDVQRWIKTRRAAAGATA
jgi:predicted DNA-binding transcriptional regulator AlpA